MEINKRYFPVSHDINSDHEVWEMTAKIGDRSLRVWLEFLSISDRNGGMLPPWSDHLAATVAYKCHTVPTKVRQVWDHGHARAWIVSDPLPRVRNHSKFHRTRSPNKSHNEKQLGAPLPNLPTYLPKEEKNKEKKAPPAVSFVPPDWIPKDVWEDFCTHRKSVRAPISPLAAERIVEQLDRLRGRGFDPAFVLNKSIANGWRGVFEPKGNEAVKQPTRPTFQPKNEDKPMSAEERENVKALLKGLVAVK